ncbi:MAG: PKD domain-containing protein [Bacteroidota bacterium]
MQMWLRKLLLLLLMFVSCGSLRATHIVGGELNYRYLGNNVYRINLTVYRDCWNGVPPFDNPASVGIFNAITNTLVREKLFTFIELDTVPPTINGPCFVPPTNICYERTVYTDTIYLPPSPGGYILAYQRCCRNMTILNIVTPDAVGATYEARISGVDVYAANSNPVFTLWPPPFICAGVPFIFDHSATDFEGDSIAYELITPHEGGTVANPIPQPPNPPPYAPVVFQAPYSQQDMLGGIPPMNIDVNTGLLTAYPNTLGQFVIGIRAKEFRNGILIGYTRRDFQLNVVPCPNLVVAALQNPLISCGSNTVAFQNFSFNAGSYFWDFGVSGINSDTSSAFEPNYTYPDTGVYTVTLIAVSPTDPGCVDTTIGSVTILPDYAPGFRFTIDPCNNTAQFFDSVAAGGTTVEWKWQFGDGSTANQSNPTHTYSQPGIYTVTLIATSDRGCIDTLRRPLLIGPALQVQPQVIAPANCFGDCNGSATVGSQFGQPPFIYQWNDPQNQNGPTAYNLCAGSYSVTVTDSRNCTAVATITIGEPAPLVINLNTTPDYCGGICAGSATVTATGGNGAYTIAWNDSLQQNGSSATGLCPGWYSAVVTDPLGCFAVDSIEVLYTDSFPSVIATADANILYYGQSTQLYALTPTGNFTYSWSPGSGLNSTSVQNPIASPTEDISYIVQVLDANGCPASDTIQLSVIRVICDEPELFVPNAFTPNADQRNDGFRIRGNTIEKMHLMIFNRWGQKVFETEDQQRGWDGRFEGRDAPADVYVVVLEATCFNKATFLKKSNLTLIR